MGAGPLLGKLAWLHGLYSSRVRGVTLMGIRNPLNELIHLVYKQPRSVLGPVEREGSCLLDLLVWCQSNTTSTK